MIFTVVSEGGGVGRSLLGSNVSFFAVSLLYMFSVLSYVRCARANASVYFQKLLYSPTAKHVLDVFIILVYF